MNVRGVPVTVGAAAVALALGFRLLVSTLRKGARTTLDGFTSVISFSSKLIAAARALEASEEHALAIDPLAERLAGPDALATARKNAKPAPSGSGRRYKIGKMAIRTRWFDDQIAAALGMPVSATVPGVLRADDAPARPDISSYVWSPTGAKKPRQVVLLGAGMDSRPWRLKLPADLRWFEVDQPEVVTAKQGLLRALGAQVPPSGSLDDVEEHPLTPLSPLSPKSCDSGLSRHTSIDKVEYPLRCGGWAAVSADLANPNWADALAAAGFDPRKPTVWVAEGLLMYLEEQAVRALLRKLADLSAEGSVLVAFSVTQALIDQIKTKGTSSPLMETWLFGCPSDPEVFMTQCNWRLRLATNRQRQAQALGLDPKLCVFPADKTDDDGAGSIFMAATPLAHGSA